MIDMTAANGDRTIVVKIRNNYIIEFLGVHDFYTSRLH